MLRQTRNYPSTQTKILVFELYSTYHKKWTKSLEHTCDTASERSNDILLDKSNIRSTVSQHLLPNSMKTTCFSQKVTKRRKLPFFAYIQNIIKIQPDVMDIRVTRHLEGQIIYFRNNGTSGQQLVNTCWFIQWKNMIFAKSH